MRTRLTLLTLAALFILASPAPGQDLHQYDPFAYDPWLDPQMETPDPYTPDLSPSPWAEPKADYWAERRRQTLDDLSRDPLGQPRWGQGDDGYREPSTRACDALIYNPAAQQRCYERLQAR